MMHLDHFSICFSVILSTKPLADTICLGPPQKTVPLMISWLLLHQHPRGPSCSGHRCAQRGVSGKNLVNKGENMRWKSP